MPQNKQQSLKRQVVSSWSSTALQLPRCAHPAVGGQKPYPALGWFPLERCAQPCNQQVNYTKTITKKPLPFPRSHTGEKDEIYLSILFCLVTPLVMIARIFFPVLQSDRGASSAQRELDSGGRELWQQHGAACFQGSPSLTAGGAGDSSIRHALPIHTSNPSQQRERRCGHRESRGRSLLPASVFQNRTCCYSQHCYLYFLQRAVILTSRLQVRAWLTVHFSLAKPAKQSRSVTAALRCFHPLLKCSQAPWQTFCTRHRSEKEMRVAFPLDTTEGISDRQNVITWPGVRPGAGPETPTLM